MVTPRAHGRLGSRILLNNSARATCASNRLASVRSDLSRHFASPFLWGPSSCIGFIHLTRGGALFEQVERSCAQAYYYHRESSSSSSSQPRRALFGLFDHRRLRAVFALLFDCYAVGGGGGGGGLPSTKPWHTVMCARGIGRNAAFTFRYSSSSSWRGDRATSAANERPQRSDELSLR